MIGVLSGERVIACPTRTIRTEASVRRRRTEASVLIVRAVGVARLAERLGGLGKQVDDGQALRAGAFALAAADALVGAHA